MGRPPVLIRRLATAAGALLLAVAPAPALAADAWADGTAGPLTLVWDGPATSLDWRGREAPIAAEGTFVGDHILVPGDRITRTATVTNSGPGAGIATVSILDVVAAGPAAEAGPGRLADLIELTWSVDGVPGSTTWAGAASAPVAFSTKVDLARGASFPLTVGVVFPASATDGKNPGGTADLVLTYRIRVDLQEDTRTGPGAPMGGAADGSAPTWLILGLAAGAAGGWLLGRRPTQTNTASGRAQPACEGSSA
ncbi:MAG: hypothetical protein FWC46_03465 [Actinomycetia bacterium]|nr:hypothetical protein [Actinomycetes bacterium]